jgi:hypothetical protein
MSKIFSKYEIEENQITKKTRLTGKPEWVYHGDHEDGVPLGFGHIDLLRRKERYEGRFQDGYFEGPGKYTYKDDMVYEGEWKRGNRDGSGTRYVVCEGNNYYRPETPKYVSRAKDGTYVWDEDQFRGKVPIMDRVCDKVCKGTIYEKGDWKNGDLENIEQGLWWE